jgi:hypothetical protein
MIRRIFSAAFFGGVMTRGNVVYTLYVAGAAVAVIGVVYSLYFYFGDPDSWDFLRSNFDTLTAFSTLMRDLVILGLGVAAILLGMAWRLDTDRPAPQSPVAMALYGIGAVGLVVALVFAFNQSFGEPDEFSQVEENTDFFAALLNLLFNLAILAGISLAVLGLGWYVDRGSRA